MPYRWTRQSRELWQHGRHKPTGSGARAGRQSDCPGCRPSWLADGAQRACRRRCMPSAHCRVSFITSAARTSSRLPMRGATDTRKRPRMVASAAAGCRGGQAGWSQASGASAPASSSTGSPQRCQRRSVAAAAQHCEYCCSSSTAQAHRCGPPSAPGSGPRSPGGLQRGGLGQRWAKSAAGQAGLAPPGE